jgi:hypothetical protein
VVVQNALVVEEETSTEVITTLRRQRLTDTLNSEWWKFVISSHIGHVWTKRCSGKVKRETYGKTVDAEKLDELPRKVDASKWYDSAR